MMFENHYTDAAKDLDFLLSRDGAASFCAPPKELHVIIYEKLIKARPYPAWDCAQYYQLALDMSQNENHPAFRFITPSK